jgi:hypothetical protein
MRGGPEEGRKDVRKICARTSNTFLNLKKLNDFQFIR